MGQTVNLLSFDFGGSNPSAPTKSKWLLNAFSFNLKKCIKGGRLKIAEVAQLIEH